MDFEVETEAGYDIEAMRVISTLGPRLDQTLVLIGGM